MAAPSHTRPRALSVSAPSHPRPRCSCYVSAPAFLSGSGGGGGSVDDCFMLSETLPGSNDAAFVTHLTACLPPLTPPTAGQTDGQTGEQRAVHVMWCATRCYANAGREVPACVYVSTHALHVLRVLAGSERGQPRLQHWHCTPLAAVQQLVLGYRKVSSVVPHRGRRRG